MHREDDSTRFHPFEALAGWVIPGLGHLLIGQRVRAAIICAGVMGLWLSGLLIGGLSVVDHLQPHVPASSTTMLDHSLEPHHQPFSPMTANRDRSLWYFGQVCVAPSLLVQQQLYRMRQQFVTQMRDPATPDPAEPYTPSFGRSYEIGQLFTALAGVLNLMVILDVLFNDGTRGDARRVTRPARRGVPTGIGAGSAASAASTASTSEPSGSPDAASSSHDADDAGRASSEPSASAAPGPLADSSPPPAATPSSDTPGHDRAPHPPAGGGTS